MLEEARGRSGERHGRRTPTFDDSPGNDGKPWAKRPPLLEPIASLSNADKINGVPTRESRQKSADDSQSWSSLVEFSIAAQHGQCGRRVVGTANTGANDNGCQEQLPSSKDTNQGSVGVSEHMLTMVSHLFSWQMTRPRKKKQQVATSRRRAGGKLKFASDCPRHHKSLELHPD